MIRAINPKNGKYVTVAEFLAEFGANYKEKNVIPKCPCEGCDLYIRGSHSPNIISGFSHMPNKNSTCRCRNQYDGPLGIPGYDGLLFKDEFCKEINIKKVYQICHDACGKKNFPINKYKELIKKANQRNVWSYVDIKIWMLPYILLTFDDFTAKDKNNQEYEFRFILLEEYNIEILGQVDEIKIRKIFANSQKEIKLFSMNEEKYEKIDATWMNDKFVETLLSVC